MLEALKTVEVVREFAGSSPGDGPEAVGQNVKVEAGVLSDDLSEGGSGVVLAQHAQ